MRGGTGVGTLSPAKAGTTGLAALPAEIRAAYEIARIGLTWYAWRNNATGDALRASTEAGITALVRRDWQQPRPRIPHQRQGS